MKYTTIHHRFTSLINLYKDSIFHRFISALFFTIWHSRWGAQSQKEKFQVLLFSLHLRQTPLRWTSLINFFPSHQIALEDKGTPFALLSPIVTYLLPDTGHKMAFNPHIHHNHNHHGRILIRTCDLSVCLYLNLKISNLDHSVTTARFYILSNQGGNSCLWLLASFGIHKMVRGDIVIAIRYSCVTSNWSGRDTQPFDKINKAMCNM